MMAWALAVVDEVIEAHRRPEFPRQAVPIWHAATVGAARDLDPRREAHQSSDCGGYWLVFWRLAKLRVQ